MMSDLLSQDEINALLSEDASKPDNETLDPTDASAAPQNQKVINDISSAFVTSWGSVFGMLTGKEVNVKVIDTSCSKQVDFISSTEKSPFVLRAKSGGLGSYPFAIVMSQSGGQILSDMMMGGEGKDLSGVLNELDISAAQEGLSQVIGSVFTRLNEIIKGNRILPEGIQAKVESDSWVLFPPNEEMDIYSIKLNISISEVSDFYAWIVLSQEMVNAYGTALEESASAEPLPAPNQQPQTSSQNNSATYKMQQPQQPQASFHMQQTQQIPSYSMPGIQQPSPIVDVRPAEFSPISSRAVSGNASKIDLVSDIPVRVTVELGRTRKNISEILAMSTGSIIELDRMAGEPVDVFVNGKLIAKGEVVVIDENFGVRVTEIINVASKAY